MQTNIKVGVFQNGVLSLDEAFFICYKTLMLFTLIKLTAIFITNSVNPPFGIQSTQAKVLYDCIFMSSVFCILHF